MKNILQKNEFEIKKSEKIIKNQEISSNENLKKFKNE